MADVRFHGRFLPMLEKAVLVAVVILLAIFLLIPALSFSPSRLTYLLSIFHARSLSTFGW